LAASPYVGMTEDRASAPPAAAVATAPPAGGPARSGTEPRRTLSTTFAVALCSLPLVLVTIFVLWWASKWPVGTDNTTKVAVAVFALVGTLVGTAVTMVGTLLKFSIDQQAENRQREAQKRLELDTARNNAMKEDEANRLKLEAAVRALQLFSTSTGQATPPAQRDGALFALDSLGQHELSLLLTDSLLEKKELSPATACTLIDHAIMRSAPEMSDLKETAISILGRHAQQMVTDGGAELPQCLQDWCNGLPHYVREWAPIAMAKIMMARSVEDWTNGYNYQATAMVAALCIAWYKETDPRLKKNVAVVVREFLLAFPHIDGVLFHPRQEIEVEDVREKIAAATSTDMHVADAVNQLKNWRSPKAAAAQAQ
jgi:hypothetical protein